jgi:hypothetical protein
MAASYKGFSQSLINWKTQKEKADDQYLSVKFIRFFFYAYLNKTTSKHNFVT